MTANQIPEAVLEAVARAICVSCEENPDHRGDARGNEFRWQDYRDTALAAINALAAAQKQGQLNVGAPRTPEQIAATVAWVQSLADSDITPQPSQQDVGEVWNRERIEAVASRVERAGDKEAADLIRDLLEAGVEAEQERIDTAPQSAAVDAERYRRLRVGDIDDIAVVRGLGAMDYGMSAVVGTYSEEIDGDVLDAAIDEAMEKENKVNG